MSIIPRESQLVGETFSENRDVKEAIETKWFSFKVDKFFMKHPVLDTLLSNCVLYKPAESGVTADPPVVSNFEICSLLSSSNLKE